MWTPIKTPAAMSDPQVACSQRSNSFFFASNEPCAMDVKTSDSDIRAIHNTADALHVTFN